MRFCVTECLFVGVSLCFRECVCVFVFSVSLFQNMRVYECISESVLMCVCVCVSECVFMCVCVCLCLCDSEYMFEFVCVSG